MNFKQRALELSKNQKAVAGLIKLGAFLVIIGVVVYCDVQFIQVMGRTFPDGAAKIFSLIGAVATGVSVVALIGAEAYWFSRGPQMLWGWIFTAIEVTISALNVILSFELTSGKVDSLMTVWLWFCPATPVVAALFWVLIFNLDQGQKARHDHREMEDDIAESDREHARAVHESKMQLKKRYLESTTTYLDQIANDPRIQAGLEAGAWRFATEQLRELTGLALPSQMPQQTLKPPTVEGSIAPASQPVKPDVKPEPEPPTPTVAPVPEPAAQEVPGGGINDLLKGLAAILGQQSAPVQPSYTDDLAASVPPAPQEPQYDVRPKEPITENLGPFAAAPMSTIGATNGHTHLKP